MKLDRSKPYATIYGHETAIYEQNGKLFDSVGDVINEQKQEQKQKDYVIQHPKVDNAREFLLHVLKNGPLTKSAVYKVAGDNNQVWDHVRDAALLLGVVKFQYQKSEMWKLPEVVPEI